MIFTEVLFNAGENPLTVRGEFALVVENKASGIDTLTVLFPLLDAPFPAVTELPGQTDVADKEGAAISCGNEVAITAVLAVLSHPTVEFFVEA